MTTPCTNGYRQLPDERDKLFPLGALMDFPEPHPVSKVWKSGDVLDQADTNSCVGHACYQLQVSEPMVRSNPPLSPFDIYNQARLIDEWGDNDDVDAGTSIRAGLNVLKNNGVIRGYYWGFDVQQVLDYLLLYGPLVFGTRWPNSMMNVDGDGFVHPEGRGGGGHAYFAHSASWKNKTVTFRNSWGEGWGKNGDFRMSFNDVEKLLKEDGACCAAVVEL